MTSRFQTAKANAFALGLILVANLPGLKQVSANAPLRADTDTVAMLNAMRDTGGLYGWWRWFVGDWFLYNGFYRPSTCLSLLVDYTLYGENGWGYRLTNWMLGVLTALAVYATLPWFAQRWLGHLPSDERRPQLLALAGAIALSLQQTNSLHSLQRLSAWLVVGGWLLWWNRSLTVAGWQRFVRTGWWHLWLVVGAFFWGWSRLTSSSFARLIVWVPSRTALLSTCLLIWSLWALLRWGDTRRWHYLIAAVLLYAGACGAYEQALALVPLALVLVIAMRKQWGWRGWLGCSLTAAVALTVVAARLALLPPSLTPYQQQQLRSSPTLGLLHLLETVLPITASLQYWLATGFNPYLFFFRSAWDHLVADLAFIGVIAAIWRSWRWCGWWLLWHALTYLPISLLHPFEHYHYLPQVGSNAFDLALIAWGTTHMANRQNATPKSALRK